MKVLVVEDYQDTAALMSVMLQHHGCETRVAASGEDAVAVARLWTPDVVLLDLGLPGIDGYEVARRLRREAAVASRIIAITGFAADSQRQQESGIDTHLVKPVKFDQLLQLMAKDLPQDPSHPN